MAALAEHNKRRDVAPLAIFGVLAVLGLALWFFFGGRPPLQRSATGFDGLVTWLRSEGFETRSYGGPPAFRAEDIGLRLLPLFDTDLRRSDLPFTTEDAQLRSGTEFDITASSARRKLERLNTVLIAPKWTRAARHSGYADPSLLSDLSNINRSLNAVWKGFPPLVRPDAKLLELQAGDDRVAALYAPQLFTPDLSAECVSLLGGAAGHLVLRCKKPDAEFIAISDPDFLNNHGLSLGDNATLVRDFITDWTHAGPIIVDLSPDRIVLHELVEQNRRSWADLARFLAWPFTALWGGAFALLALAIWRGTVRFGPPSRPFDNRMGASKEISIRAKANLLRLAGKDAEILKTHVANRLQLAASQILGPAVGKREPRTALFKFLRQRRSGLANALEAALVAAEAPPDNSSVAALLQRLDRFETQLEKVMHEFGRTARPG